ncbi:MAG: type I methionyl aminopeptidase [Holosporales bacterium]|jgi:methionyl aminopeptidase|nr:type I methionyl aminopeptidase [Holosporales bacterium]
MEEIKIHTASDLGKMRLSGKLAKQTLDYIEPYITSGTTTDEINRLCHDFIVSHGAIPASLNYKGFPKSVCTSVNHVVCHGIPGVYKLKEGDIVNVDVTVILDGWHGDTSRTFLVGKCTKLANTLVDVARQALAVGISATKPYGHFGDIGKAIQRFVDGYGFSVVRDYCGHGIGQAYHDAPCIVHFDSLASGPQLLPGMFFTVEPMVNAGTYKTKCLKDGWTVITCDKSLSAQFEHTIAVTETSVEVLTA